MQKNKFNIQGMTCSSCSSHVEKAVKQLNGVEEVSVNLLSNNMIVLYDENVLNDKDIINAVVSAGYGATVYSGKNEKSKSSFNEFKSDENIKLMKKRLMISAFFLIPLMYIAMHQMLNHTIGLPIPQSISNLFDGAQNAIIFAFTQLLLLMPIIYLNRNYFMVRIQKAF